MVIILILVSALIGVGSYVKDRGNIDLTKGMLETLCSSLSQYYNDFESFPFDADLNFDEVAFENTFLPVVANVTPDNSLEGTDGDGATVLTASSAALFYFLDKNPSSRAIAGDIPASMMTNKDENGTAITVTIGTNPPIDLPRYIDPWEMSIRYEYLAGTAFPILTSAGPDKLFDTPDDITSK